MKLFQYQVILRTCLFTNVFHRVLQWKKIQCAFGLMIVGAKDVIDEEITNIIKSYKKCSDFKDTSLDEDIAVLNEW